MALDDDIALLARQPLLGLMERDALRLVAFAAESRIMRAGDVLFRAGESSDGAFLVISGGIALSTGDDGKPADDIVGPGALIGEMALFSALERSVTAIAREPTQVMKLSRAVMRRVLGESPDSAVKISEAIAQRLQGFVGELTRVQHALTAIDQG